MPKPNRPTTRVVVLVEATNGGVTLELAEEFPAASADIATQLHDTGEFVRSRLTLRSVDRALVRRADPPAVANKAEGPRRRLLMEGSVISAARSVVVDTRVGTGKETGSWFGSNKAGADDAGRQFCLDHSIPVDYAEAASAALAALRL
jgi:hypothetical protein